MHNRIKQITSLVILVGASALVGCASQVPTTDKWAISNGYQRVELKGKEYFCRQEPVVTGSNRSRVACLRLAQLWEARWAGPSPAEGFPNPVPVE